MENKVDARGQQCPKPVIMTKKQLDAIEDGIVITIVDNEVAKENVSKLAKGFGFDYKVEQTKEDEFYIYITKGEPKDISKPIIKLSSNSVISISSNKMGSGEEELGVILIKSFFYTVRETSPYPESIIFYNSGVYLTCEGSPVLDDLIALSEEGVDIQSCGTCLDFYNLKDKLAVGGVSNMYSIYEIMKGSNTINI